MCKRKLFRLLLDALYIFYALASCALNPLALLVAGSWRWRKFVSGDKDETAFLPEKGDEGRARLSHSF